MSEQLEYVPASFKVIRHVRPKLACVRCQRIFQADAPSRAIQRGLPGPGLLAQVLVAKYCDHTPLYRQSRIYAREGVDIARSTMVDWVAQSAALLDPLVAALGRYALSAAKLHSDDTPVKVLDPGRGKTKTARLWVYVRDDRPSGSADPPAAWYRYSADRKGEHLARMLRLPRHPAGRRLCRVCQAVRARQHRRGGVLGACPTALLGRVRQPKAHSRLAGRAGPAAHRRVYEIEAPSAATAPSSAASNAGRAQRRCCSSCTPG